MEQVTAAGGVIPEDEVPSPSKGNTSNASVTAPGADGTSTEQQEFARWEAENAAANASQAAAASGKQVDSTAQALLNSITQPVGAPQSVAGPAPAAFTSAPPSATQQSSTIDMKALGGGVPATTAGSVQQPGTWNNNAVSTAANAVVAAPAPSAVTAPGGSAPAGGSGGSTLDLKAIGGGTTVDMDVLKWQDNNGGQQMAAPNATAAAPPAAGPVAMAVNQIKRSSSVDSPGQDEERLTVVEGDESSQDSVNQQQQQHQQQSAAAAAGTVS